MSFCRLGLVDNMPTIVILFSLDFFLLVTKPFTLYLKGFFTSTKKMEGMVNDGSKTWGKRRKRGDNGLSVISLVPKVL